MGVTVATIIQNICMELMEMILFSSVILLFVSIVFAKQKPKLTLCLLIFIKPIVAITREISFNVGGVNFNINAIVGIFIIVFSILVLNSKFLKDKNVFIVFLIWIWIILVQVLWFLCFGGSGQFFEEIIRFVSILALFMTGYALINSRKEMDGILNYILISSFVPLIVGFWQKLNNIGLPFYENWYDIKPKFYAIYSLFSNPNSFAVYLCFIFFVSLYKSRFEFRPNRYLVFELIIMFCLYYTYSRISMVAIFVSILIIIFIKYNRFFKAVIPIFILTLIYILFENGYEFLAAGKGLSSIVWRINTWKVFFDNMEFMNYFIGKGFGSSWELMESLGREARQPHNDYLRIFFELGLVGLALYYGLILFEMKEILKKIKIKKENEVLIFGSIAISSVFVLGLTENIYRDTTFQWCFWICFGMILKIIQKGKTVEKNVCFK